MNDPAITCGGPDGRRLLALGLQAEAVASLTVLSVRASLTARAALTAAEALAALAAVLAADGAVSTRTLAASAASTRRAVTGTPPGGGSGPRPSRPPSAGTPRSCRGPGR